VEDLAAAGAGRVEHDHVGAVLLGPGQGGVPTGEGPDHERHPLAHPAGLLDRLPAVELGGPQPRLVRELHDPRRRLVAEDPDREDLRRQALGDVRGPRRGDEPRRRRHEVEADGVGAHGHREQRVLLGGDPADLHEHAGKPTGVPPQRRGTAATAQPAAARSARTAAWRSPEVTTDSPTRTAWKPAAARRGAAPRAPPPGPAPPAAPRGRRPPPPPARRGAPPAGAGARRLAPPRAAPPARGRARAAPPR